MEPFHGTGKLPPNENYFFVPFYLLGTPATMRGRLYPTEGSLSSPQKAVGGSIPLEVGTY